VTGPGELGRIGTGWQGVFIGAWCDLPIEAVMVWMAVTYGTVILFEGVKIWQASERSAKDVFLGPML
jgi:hypothetical protein